MKTNTDAVSIIGIIITILLGAISLYAQFKNPETGIILFILLLGAIFLYFLISWPISFLKNKFTIIDDNKRMITKLNKDLYKLKDNLDIYKRLEKLELKNEIKKK